MSGWRNACAMLLAVAHGFVPPRAFVDAGEVLMMAKSGVLWESNLSSATALEFEKVSDPLIVDAAVGRVNAVVAGATGDEMFVGGSFDGVGGASIENVAKWTGSSWEAIGSGVYSVFALAYDDARGILYAGGSRWMVNDACVAMYDFNNVGTGWSELGSSCDGDWSVKSLALDPTSGHLYAAGDFTTIGGVSANRVAKWDGTSWTALGTGLNDDASSIIFDNTNGVLYAGGSFTTAGGVSTHQVALWNGATWSSLGTRSSSTYSAAYSLALSTAGTLYVGGRYLSASSTPSIQSWNGATWTNINTDYGRIDTLAIDVTTGHLYAGGSFTTIGGVAASRVAKWDGASWSAVGAGADSSGEVYAITQTKSNKMCIGGEFQRVSTTPASSLFLWNPSTSSYPKVFTDVITTFISVRVMIDTPYPGYVYVGGIFITMQGVAARGVARWDGTSWSALGAGISGTVEALAYDSSNNVLYVGGTFSLAGSTIVSNIAKWDGASWSSVGSSVGANDAVRDLHYDSTTNTLYAGGAFYSIGGVSANGVAKWDGVSWSAFGSGVGGDVYAIAYDSVNSVLYAGGTVSSAGGVSVNKIARWDGTSWSSLGAGVDSYVYSLAYDATNQYLYVVGRFLNAGTVATSGVAKWDGTSWSAVGLGIGIAGISSRIIYDAANAKLYASSDKVYKWDGLTWISYSTSASTIALVDSRYSARSLSSTPNVPPTSSTPPTPPTSSTPPTPSTPNASTGSSDANSSAGTAIYGAIAGAILGPSTLFSVLYFFAKPMLRRFLLRVGLRRLADALVPENLNTSVNELTSKVKDIQMFMAKQKLPRLTDTTPIIERNDVVLDAQGILGAGGYGAVFKGTFKSTQVAIKTMFAQAGTQEMQVPRAAVESMRKEALIMCTLNHPNIVKVFGIVPEVAWIVMEYCPRGSLSELLANDAMDISDREKLRFASEIATGVAYLHLPGISIVHGDLKSANVLIAADGSSRLCDFGMSHAKNRSKTLTMAAHAKDKGHALTIAWSAPELFADKEKDTRTDVYALAVTLWEIFERRTPFGYMPEAAVVTQVLSGVRPTFKETPSDAQSLITLSWAHDPKTRIDASQVAFAFTRMYDASATETGPAQPP
uniref:Protein kinase domain-containing protein n=1 Tax=Ostreococcus mediterraneus TaxID=1486918 RepID=A0A7S0Z8T4_9CHLO